MCFARSNGHGSIFVRSRFGLNQRAPVSRPRVNLPDHWPRYDCTSHQTILVRSGHRSKCVRCGHQPLYVRFSHRPRYDRSGHRTMSVRFGHRPFCVRFSHQYRLGSPGHQSGLWTPADWSTLTSGSVGPSGPSAGHVVPSRTIHPDHSVRLDLGTTFSALHHTIDRGRVSSPPPPWHKAGRRS